MNVLGYLKQLTDENNWMVASTSFTALNDDVNVIAVPTYLPTGSPTVVSGGDGGGDDNVFVGISYGVDASEHVSLYLLLLLLSSLSLSTHLNARNSNGNVFTIHSYSHP